MKYWVREHFQWKFTEHSYIYIAKKIGQKIFANAVKIAMQSLAQDKHFSPGKNFYAYSSMKITVLSFAGSWLRLASGRIR